jgi:hypothetical protein
MTYAVGKDTQLFADQYDLTSYLQGVDPTLEVEMRDSTVFGDAGRKSTPGLTSGGIGFDALYDRTAGSAFDFIRTALQSALQQIVTSFPEGATLGYPADLCYANTANFSAPVKVGDLLMVTGYFKSAEDGVDVGIALHAKSAETGTFTGSSVDNGAATSNGGVGVIHVPAIAGAAPSVVVKIQHSSNNSTWTDLITFAAATAATKERVEVAAGTTVNRYTRTIGTFGGTTTSITPVVAFARR